MATFPKLRTGAVMQYPAVTVTGYSNQVVRFVDGEEQRYRDSAGPLRRWKVDLALLDDGELASLEEFFEAQQGRYGTFTFTDPHDGREYSDCRLEEDQFTLELEGESRGKATLLVREVRS
ncbi:MAG: DUF2460 domain-containing protein [Bryobacterales bacterium]|nr:DUF2460 domain-containing protein [Bryobacterales bacterium]